MAMVELAQALASQRCYRKVHGNGHGVRILAFTTAGDFMANTPLDFLTNHLNVRLDLLYILPDRPLP